MEIDPKIASGSRVRPLEMVLGFEDAGYQVEKIWGYAQERKKAIEQVRRNLRNGVKYEFAYSESSTMPTILTERHHVPTHPILDYQFFFMCHRAGIPIGLFYRDVQWQLRRYRQQLKWYKKAILIPSYHLDLLVYRRWIDALFLPHAKMVEYVRFWPERKPVQSLPPGARIVPLIPVSSDSPLRLLYVGGIHPILYDISNLLEGVGRASAAGVNVHLTLCCPEPQWHARPPEYNIWHGDWLTVVHFSGEQLYALYEQNSIALLYLVPTPYCDFAMPVKLFEAIGVGRPLITVQGTAFGDFVEENKCGWSIPADPAALTSLLFQLQSDPASVEEAAHVTLSIQHQHSWKKRAEQVASTLQALCKSD